MKNAISDQENKWSRGPDQQKERRSGIKKGEGGCDNSLQTQNRLFSMTKRHIRSSADAVKKNGINRIKYWSEKSLQK